MKALWLGLFDIARRTVRISGLPRFIAVALLSGYAWLGVAGLLAVRWGPVAAGLSYDAMLHAVFDVADAALSSEAMQSETQLARSATPAPTPGGPGSAGVSPAS